MTRVVLLGGIGTFGMNGLLIDDGGRKLMVDAGLRFLSDAAGYGHRALLFDLDDDLRPDAVVLTHAHEDHIGALPHLGLDDVPMWATPFTARLIAQRFARQGQRAPRIEVVPVGGRATCAGFDVEFVAVNHSIPDSAALRIETTAGVIVHSGDFRCSDAALLGAVTDMDRLRAIGTNDDVQALFTDSTGALTEGLTAPDTTLVEPLAERLAATEGQVVISTYARHVERHLVVAEACRRAGRRLCVVGRSIPASLSAAEVTLGAGVLARGELTSVPRGQRCVLVSGCQAEPQGNLMRIARDQVPHVTLDEGDEVWISARVIPGNEDALRGLADRLAPRGVRVHTAVCHTSGHGGREDLRALIRAVRPKTVVPIHGGTAQLLAHAALAEDLGVPALRVREGDVLDLDDGPLRVAMTRPLRHLLLEGDVLRDDDVRDQRRRMAEAGVCVVDVRTTPPTVLLHATHKNLVEARLCDALAHKDEGVAWADAVAEAAQRMKAACPAVVVRGPDAH